MALYVNRGITGPLAGMTSAMKRLASGDLGIAIPAIGRRDEIGHMAEAVGVFKEGMIDARRLRDRAEGTTGTKGTAASRN